MSTAGLVVGVAGATDDPLGAADGRSGGPPRRVHVDGGGGVRVRLHPARLGEGRPGPGEARAEGATGGRTGGVGPNSSRTAGLTREVAMEAAAQLTERDALRAHARVELNIDPDDSHQPLARGLGELPVLHGRRAAAAAGDRPAAGGLAPRRSPWCRRWPHCS
ncbi:hypothetical protein ACRAWF_27970 [Streptomyces sp. L7]